jgi:zinc protease
VAELVQTAFQQIDSMKLVPPTAEDVQKVQEIQRRRREVDLKENRFWLGQLNSVYWYNIDPTHILEYPTFVNNLKPTDIQEAAKKYFDVKNYVKVVLVPEEKH